VLVRPMLVAGAAARPNLHPVVSTQASMPYSQPGVVDLRRPKRPAPTGSHVAGPGVGRRKPKSLSPTQAPRCVDEAHLTDKRRRFTVEAPWPPPTSARFGCYFPPTPTLRGPPAAVAACMGTARPDVVARLPVYYGGMSAPLQRAEPNGYDAPLELTTKRARDRN